MNVYLAMYSTEISIFVALCVGLGIGMLIGHSMGKELRYKRDSRGRFIK